jgi:hypothetical protein
VPGAIDALQQVSLFDDLEPAELQHIADAMHELVYRSGDPVTIEGADGDAFFVVGSGTAEVVVDGEPRATIGPSGHFGEIALLQGSQRTATVRPPPSVTGSEQPPGGVAQVRNPLYSGTDVTVARRLPVPGRTCPIEVAAVR